MRGQSCKRVWQAEAREDGRLEASDLASFERHAATCNECSSEITALRALVQQMSSLPEPSPTELERRRARSELLRKANEQLTIPKDTPKRWWTLAIASVLVVAMASGGHFLGNRAEPPPTFSVQDLGHTDWSVETNQSTSRVKMHSGTAAFQVEHVQNEARFFVEMPDGTIEVRGTYFVVNVQDGQTRSVEVIEGAVLLRLPKFDGLLRAGERWPASTAGAPTMEASASPNPTPNENVERAEPKNSSTIASAAIPSITARANTSVTSSPPLLERGAFSASEEPISPPMNTAGPRFTEAMNAFSAGDYGRADSLFAAFVDDFPRDGRAEDATFLRAQARIRRGDKAGAAAIAREYIRAFPRGLRRPEAERLAGEP